MFGIPFSMGYSCLQFGQIITPSSTWILPKKIESIRTISIDMTFETADLEQNVMKTLQEIVIEHLRHFER